MRTTPRAVALLAVVLAAAPSQRREESSEKREALIGMRRSDSSLFSLLPSPFLQAPSTCAVVLDSARKSVSHATAIGQRLFGSGGVFMHCRGQQTTMRSDSAAYYQDLDRVDFVGHVFFRDSVVTLKADRAGYHVKDERLEAYEHVSLANRRTGSQLTGSNLIYKRAAQGVRDTSELYARERPVVQYHSEKDTAGAEPYVIIGSTVLMKGDNAAWAQGDVTITRSDFHAAADSASLDLNAGRGQLVGHAKVAGKDSAFTLDGRLIDYRLKDRKLTWARSNGLAEARSKDWQLSADTMQFAFDSDRIQSGSAWGTSRRPHAISSDQTVTADSLVIEAPGQALKELRGIRTARATARADSAFNGPPNWMAGDTIVAGFDTTGAGKRYLSRLTASGHAQAFYYVFGEDRKKEPAISYNRGKLIAARFGPDSLERVDVSGGDADGVYLEPAPKKDSVAKKDSTAKADTLRRGRGH